MAAASLTVYGDSNKTLRTYGGNRSDVRDMEVRYERMTLEEFLRQHPASTENDYLAMTLSTRYNK